MLVEFFFLHKRATLNENVLATFDFTLGALYKHNILWMLLTFSSVSRLFVDAFHLSSNSQKKPKCFCSIYCRIKTQRSSIIFAQKEGQP